MSNGKLRVARAVNFYEDRSQKSLSRSIQKIAHKRQNSALSNSSFKSGVIRTRGIKRCLSGTSSKFPKFENSRPKFLSGEKKFPLKKSNYFTENNQIVKDLFHNKSRSKIDNSFSNRKRRAKRPGLGKMKKSISDVFESSSISYRKNDYKKKRFRNFDRKEFQSFNSQNFRNNLTDLDEKFSVIEEIENGLNQFVSQDNGLKNLCVNSKLKNLRMPVLQETPKNPNHRLVKKLRQSLVLNGQKKKKKITFRKKINGISAIKQRKMKLRESRLSKNKKATLTQLLEGTPTYQNSQPIDKNNENRHILANKKKDMFFFPNSKPLKLNQKIMNDPPKTKLNLSKVEKIRFKKKLMLDTEKINKFHEKDKQPLQQWSGLSVIKYDKNRGYKQNSVASPTQSGDSNSKEISSFQVPSTSNCPSAIHHTEARSMIDKYEAISKELERIERSFEEEDLI
jgi:hypothetical protein